MDLRTRRRTAIGILFSVLVVASFAFFRYFSISSEKSITYLARLPTDFISATVSTDSVVFALQQIAADFIKFFIPFIPLVLAFSLLVVYGVKYEEDRKLGLAAALVSSLIGVFIVGFSFASLFLAIGIVICGIFLTSVSQMYYNELKKWREYRVGSHTISKCFFTINILLCIGIFLMVLPNLDYYADLYKEETKNMITQILPEYAEEEALKEAQKIEGFKDLPPDKQEEFLQQYKDQLNKREGEAQLKIDEMVESKNITAFFYLSILLTVLVIYGVLDFLKTLIFSPIAGLVTKISLRYPKEESP